MSILSPSVLSGLVFVTAAAVGGSNADAADVEGGKPTAKYKGVTPIKDALLPAEIKLKRAATDEEKQAASAEIINLQPKIELFGPGPEGHITFTHNGKRYKDVPIDLDRGMIRLTKTGFVVIITPAMLEPAHEEVMTGADNVAKEQKFRETALTQYIPLDHADAQPWYIHVFTAAGHNIQIDPIKSQIIDIAKPLIDKKNEALRTSMESAAKAAPAPTPEK